MMVRLQERGWLKHREAGRTFYYAAARAKASSLGAKVSQMIDRFFAGSPEEMVTTQLDGPIAAGWLHPSVVLPQPLIAQITFKQLREILVHELAHIVRHDQIVVLLQNIAQAVFWLHPLARMQLVWRYGNQPVSTLWTTRVTVGWDNPWMNTSMSYPERLTWYSWAKIIHLWQFVDGAARR